jgi:hypothetical protein
MRAVVRGRTIGELNRNAAAKERAGWKRITENKLDVSGSNGENINWVCVMEIENKVVDKKRKWGYMNAVPY